MREGFQSRWGVLGFMIHVLVNFAYLTTRSIHEFVFQLQCVLLGDDEVVATCCMSEPLSLCVGSA